MVPHRLLPVRSEGSGFVQRSAGHACRMALQKQLLILPECECGGLLHALLRPCCPQPVPQLCRDQDQHKAEADSHKLECLSHTDCTGIWIGARSKTCMNACCKLCVGRSRTGQQCCLPQFMMLLEMVVCPGRFNLCFTYSLQFLSFSSECCFCCSDHQDAEFNLCWISFGQRSRPGAVPYGSTSGVLEQCMFPIPVLLFPSVVMGDCSCCDESAQQGCWWLCVHSHEAFAQLPSSEELYIQPADDDSIYMSASVRAGSCGHPYGGKSSPILVPNFS